jgi:HPr kinase/phosphorylase
MSEYHVELGVLAQEINLERIYLPERWDKTPIKSSDVNRPGLQLGGFFDYFDKNRIQVIGMVETTYLSNLTSTQRLISFERLFQMQIPAIMISRGLEVYSELLVAAEKYSIPVFRSEQSTSNLVASLYNSLNFHLAPRIGMHGVLIEVYGEGILITGDSGVGKSETAIELVKRGHRLIADDIVDIKRISDRQLLGTAPENVRHFIELRGLGVVDIRRLFGMGSIKESEQIEMVIKLENWENGKQYERLGLDNNFIEILGNSVPYVVIPVQPGRNLAIIIEVAAMNNRQKKMGFNAAIELNNRLLREMGTLDVDM